MRLVIANTLASFCYNTHKIIDTDFCTGLQCEFLALKGVGRPQGKAII